jgi:hypothetical protein
MVKARLAVLALMVGGGCVMAPDEPDAAAAAPRAGLGITDPSVEAVYVLQAGDTLGAIARRFAVPGGWRVLAEVNGIGDADRVEAGRGLVIRKASPYPVLRRPPVAVVLVRAFRLGGQLGAAAAAAA